MPGSNVALHYQRVSCTNIRVFYRDVSFTSMPTLTPILYNGVITLAVQLESELIVPFLAFEL